MKGSHRYRRDPFVWHLAATLLSVTATVSGCGNGDPNRNGAGPGGSVAAGAGVEDPLPRPVSGHFFDSPEDVAREALTLFEAGDSAALLRLALTEADFRAAVYPRLPASRPERNTSARFLWEMLQQRSRNSLAYTFDRYRGRSYELVAVDFVGETTDYGQFRIHRETVLTVRASDGQRGTLRLFGSMLEQQGRYQIFSFVTD